MARGRNTSRTRKTICTDCDLDSETTDMSGDNSTHGQDHDNALVDRPIDEINQFQDVEDDSMVNQEGKNKANDIPTVMQDPEDDVLETHHAENGEPEQDGNIIGPEHSNETEGTTHNIQGNIHTVSTTSNSDANDITLDEIAPNEINIVPQAQLPEKENGIFQGLLATLCNTVAAQGENVNQLLAAQTKLCTVVASQETNVNQLVESQANLCTTVIAQGQDFKNIMETQVSICRANAELLRDIHQNSIDEKTCRKHDKTEILTHQSELYEGLKGDLKVMESKLDSISRAMKDVRPWAEPGNHDNRCMASKPDSVVKDARQNMVCVSNTTDSDSESSVSDHDSTSSKSLANLVSAQSIDRCSTSSHDSSRLRRPKLPAFSGTETWEVWLNRFNDVAKRFDWTEEEKLDEILPKLTGNAGEFVFGQLSSETRGNFQLLTKELGFRFKRIESSKTYSMQFSSRNQKPGETVENYAADLKRLYDKAHKGRDLKTRCEDLLRRFFDGLVDEEAKVQVEFVKSPSSIDSAVADVVNFMETRRNSLSLDAEGKRSRRATRKVGSIHMVRPCESEIDESESENEEGADDEAPVRRINRAPTELRSKSNTSSNNTGNSKPLPQSSSQAQSCSPGCSELLTKVESAFDKMAHQIGDLVNKSIQNSSSEKQNQPQQQGQNNMNNVKKNFGQGRGKGRQNNQGQGYQNNSGFQNRSNNSRQGTLDQKTIGPCYTCGLMGHVSRFCEQFHQMVSGLPSQVLRPGSVNQVNLQRNLPSVSQALAGGNIGYENKTGSNQSIAGMSNLSPMAPEFGGEKPPVLN